MLAAEMQGGLTLDSKADTWWVVIQPYGGFYTAHRACWEMQIEANSLALQYGFHGFHILFLLIG